MMDLRRRAGGGLAAGTGKFHFELSPVSISYKFYIIGLVPGVKNWTDFAFDTSTFCAYNSGSTSTSTVTGYSGTTSVGFANSLSTPTPTLMLAWDRGAGKIWFGFDGTWISGNPASGTSPSISGLPNTLTLYPYITTPSSASAPNVIGFVPSSPLYLPSGFNVWGGTLDSSNYGSGATVSGNQLTVPTNTNWRAARGDTRH
jgi:hypothetical protein